MPSPSPRLAPVTTTLRIRAYQLSGGRHLQPRHDTDGRRSLVCGERLAAALQQLVRELLWRRARPPGLAVGEHDVRDHHRPRDRTASRAHQGHAHPGVSVDDRLDLLRIHLESADVDYAAPAAKKIAAPAALLDEIARVDRPVGPARKRHDVFAEIAMS